MRGFITVDRQPGSSLIALWTTSCVEKVPNHVNAVVVDLDTDVDALWKVRTLTREAAVVMTAGSEHAGLPFDNTPHEVEDLAALGVHTASLQRQILEAVRAFSMMPSATTGKKPKSPRAVVYPDFEPLPELSQFIVQAGRPELRALGTANYCRALWRHWISADEQRRRRVRSPKDVTPWMMPLALNSEELAVLPPDFVRDLRIESASIGDLRRATVNSKYERDRGEK